MCTFLSITSFRFAWCLPTLGFSIDTFDHLPFAFDPLGILMKLQSSILWYLSKVRSERVVLLCLLEDQFFKPKPPKLLIKTTWIYPVLHNTEMVALWWYLCYWNGFSFIDCINPHFRWNRIGETAWPSNLFEHSASSVRPVIPCKSLRQLIGSYLLCQGLHKKTGKISIILEDLSRDSVFFHLNLTPGNRGVKGVCLPTANAVTTTGNIMGLMDIIFSFSIFFFCFDLFLKLFWTNHLRLSRS